MCMDVAQGLMPLTNMLIATHLIHVYYFYFEGTGNSEVFMFQDEGGYGDNSGSLSIEIWERGNSDQETETNNYLNQTSILYFNA